MSDVRVIKKTALTLVIEGKTKEQVAATLNEIYEEYSFYVLSNNVFMSSELSAPHTKII